MAKKAESKRVILAVAYCRKSTLEERTEKSIADQTARIKKLVPTEAGVEYKIVKWYDKDKGVPGWKRGASRPDFNKLVNELQQTGAKAILVDEMDRFSRAKVGEVVHDVQSLLENHGVRYIHSANQGCVDLINDEYAFVKIAFDAMGSHTHSTRLSRRIANARLDAAMQGKRSGGNAPYGMKNVMEHSAKYKRMAANGFLEPGDPKEIKVVMWIFEQFVTNLKSMNWIAKELNRKKVPSSRGRLWHISTVKDLMEQRAYVGDFVYNRKKSGEFHIINENKEVVPVSKYLDKTRLPWKQTETGVIEKKGTHKPMVPPKLFEAAQRRLATFALRGGRKPREDGFPLSGILVCNHCGRPMYGCRPTERGQRVYRCSSPSKHGTCNRYQIHEGQILPFVMELLGEEITNLKKMLSMPPQELCRPNQERAEVQEQTAQERAKLAAQIAKAVANIMDIEDARTRKDVDKQITAMRDELEKMDGLLAAPKPKDNGYDHADLDALAKWWDDFTARAVSVPVPGKLPDFAAFWQDPFTEEQAMLLDARVVNEALRELGVEVRLQWSKKLIHQPNGKTHYKYTLERGRFRLGQRVGEVNLCKAPRIEVGISQFC